ncbi:DNA breaking-rejoining enzyme, partial [Peniophora sp. CONT]
QREVLASSVTPSTLENYAAGLLRFTQCCDTLRIPENARMPASDDLLATFVALQVGKGADVRHCISGLQLWHTINSAPWKGGRMLKAAMQAHQRFVPDDARRPPRPPVTVEHLTALRERLNFDDPLEACVYAVACVAFWSVCRLGELLPVSEDYDHARVVKRSAVRFDKITKARDGTLSLTFHIPYDKVKHELGADICVPNMAVQTSAINALRFHLLRSSRDLPGNAPLFAYAEGHGGYRVLTKKIFMFVCDRVWSAAGIPVVAYGHSFRIGGTTEHLLRGTPPEVVMIWGRWSSMAFLKYWRKCSEIVPLFAETGSYTSNAVASFAKRMVQFRRVHNIRFL